MFLQKAQDFSVDPIEIKLEQDPLLFAKESAIIFPILGFTLVSSESRFFVPNLTLLPHGKRFGEEPKRFAARIRLFDDDPSAFFLSGLQRAIFFPPRFALRASPIARRRRPFQPRCHR